MNYGKDEGRKVSFPKQAVPNYKNFEKLLKSEPWVRGDALFGSGACSGLLHGGLRVYDFYSHCLLVWGKEKPKTDFPQTRDLKHLKFYLSSPPGAANDSYDI